MTRDEEMAPDRDPLAREEWRTLAKPSLLARELTLDGQRYQLTMEQARTLFDVGRFRAVRMDDLQRFTKSEEDRIAETVRVLKRQKLVTRKTVTSPKDGSRLDLVVLSPTGKKLLEQATAGTGQRYYAGLVKPRELAHDTGVYRMFQQEAQRIWNNGGYIERVVLDHELKAGIFSLQEKGKQEGKRSSQELQEEAAAQFQLSIVDGKIPLPDLRIEYRTAGGDCGQIDLELATGHYKASQRAAKARAGFTVYSLAPAGRSHRGGTPHGEDLLREVFGR